MYHASPGESSAMLLLKMLQPDEGIVALGEDILGSCQSLRRQQACTFNVWSSRSDILRNAVALSLSWWQNHHPPRRFFCAVISDWNAVMFPWQPFGDNVECWGGGICDFDHCASCRTVKKGNIFPACLIFHACNSRQVQNTTLKSLKYNVSASDGNARAGFADSVLHMDQ